MRESTSLTLRPRTWTGNVWNRCAKNKWTGRNCRTKKSAQYCVHQIPSAHQIYEDDTHGKDKKHVKYLIRKLNEKTHKDHAGADKGYRTSYFPRTCPLFLPKNSRPWGVFKFVGMSEILITCYFLKLLHNLMAPKCKPIYIYIYLFMPLLKQYIIVILRHQCPNKKGKFRNWPLESLRKRRRENSEQSDLLKACLPLNYIPTIFTEPLAQKRSGLLFNKIVTISMYRLF